LKKAKPRYRVRNITPNIQLNRTMADFKEFLANEFTLWTIIPESTKTIRLKSKILKGISLLINIEVDLTQSGNIDYRKIGLVDIKGDKPDNRNINDSEMKLLSDMVEKIKNYFK